MHYTLVMNRRGRDNRWPRSLRRRPLPAVRARPGLVVSEAENAYMAKVACAGEGAPPSVPRAADGCVAGAWRWCVAVGGRARRSPLGAQPVARGRRTR